VSSRSGKRVKVKEMSPVSRTPGSGTTAVIPWGCLISDRMHGSVVEGHHRRGGRIIRTYAVGRPLTGAEMRPPRDYTVSSPHAAEMSGEVCPVRGISVPIPSFRVTSAIGRRSTDTNRSPEHWTLVTAHR
jgi:hypothetical protein